MEVLSHVGLLYTHPHNKESVFLRVLSALGITSVLVMPGWFDVINIDKSSNKLSNWSALAYKQFIP